MITVKQMIERLKEFDENAEITFDAANEDGPAWCDMMVGGYCMAGTSNSGKLHEIEFC